METEQQALADAKNKKKTNGKTNGEEITRVKRQAISDIDMISNARFNWMNDLYAGGSKVQTIVKLDYPLSQKKVLLPPGINMKISIKRNDNEWIMLTDSSCPPVKFVIDRIYLTCRLRIPTSEIFAEITRKLISDSVCKYNFLRTTLVAHFLPKEQLEHKITLFKSVAPSVVFIFMVDYDACSGSYHKNPLKFLCPPYQHVSLDVEGLTYPTNGYNMSTPFTPNSHTNQCKAMYLDLYNILSQRFEVGNCGLTFDKWCDGTTVIGFQISGKMHLSRIFLLDLCYVFQRVSPVTTMCRRRRVEIQY